MIHFTTSVCSLSPDSYEASAVKENWLQLHTIDAKLL